MYAHEGKTLDRSGEHQAQLAAQPEQSLLRADHHRPVYHFLPPASWMNDPNGLIQWKGVYHMFYQYNPLGRLPPQNTVGPRDQHGPCALDPPSNRPGPHPRFAGRRRLLFGLCGGQRRCTDDHLQWPSCEQPPQAAASMHSYKHQWRRWRLGGSDSLTTWQKYPGNPVIAGPPPDLDVVEFRDHCVWKEEDVWYQVIGSGIREVGGAALLYRSTEGGLHNWEYMHPLLIGDVHQMAPLWTGSMWECPDFFSLGEGHILVVSVWYAEHLYYSVCFTGTYSNSDHRFVPEHLHKLDFGASFYAPQTLRDEGGRRIMWGWLREERDEGAQLAAGWSGVMSLPRASFHCGQMGCWICALHPSSRC